MYTKAFSSPRGERYPSGHGGASLKKVIADVTTRSDTYNNPSFGAKRGGVHRKIGAKTM